MDFIRCLRSAFYRNTDKQICNIFQSTVWITSYINDFCPKCFGLSCDSCREHSLATSGTNYQYIVFGNGRFCDLSYYHRINAKMCISFGNSFQGKKNSSYPYKKHFSGGGKHLQILQNLLRFNSSQCSMTFFCYQCCCLCIVFCCHCLYSPMICLSFLRFSSRVPVLANTLDVPAT